MQDDSSSTQLDAQEIIRFLRGLRAVRHFLPQPIPQNVIDSVEEVVRWSGSASNRQPWEIVVVRSADTLKALSAVEGHAAHVAGAALAIVLVMAGNADLVDQETYDEGRLSERIMLAAAAFGVGSCIGWFFGEGQTEAKKLLGIPQDQLVRTVISLGYVDPKGHSTRRKRDQPRKPIEQIVHVEHYGGE